MNSARNILSARQGTATDSAVPDFYDTTTSEYVAFAEGRDPFLYDLPNEGGSSAPLVIPAVIRGVRGAIVARFIDFRSFHAQEIDRG